MTKLLEQALRQIQQLPEGEQDAAAGALLDYVKHMRDMRLTDVEGRVVRDLLTGFVARGSTVFLTSHVLEIVERLCTHVGIIVKGELVEQASLETIRRGGSLEDCFLQKAGADLDASPRLNWLEESAP